jgi:hypothetical protein
MEDGEALFSSVGPRSVATNRLALKFNDFFRFPLFLNYKFEIQNPIFSTFPPSTSRLPSA